MAKSTQRDPYDKTKRKSKTNPGATLQTFTNNTFVDEKTEATEATFKNNGFLNKRPGNPENDLHRALDSMADEINGTKRKNGNDKVKRCNYKNNDSTVIHVIPEEIKWKKFKELTVKELEELGEINACQDRFRYRFTEDDYKGDVIRSITPSISLRWID